MRSGTLFATMCGVNNRWTRALTTRATTARLLAEASAKRSPALKANSPKATATAPKAKPAALKTIAAPKPAAAAPKAKVTSPKPSGATSKAQIAVAPKAKVAVPVSTNSQAISTLKATSGKAAAANLAEVEPRVAR